MGDVTYTDQDDSYRRRMEELQQFDHDYLGSLWDYLSGDDNEE
jgi:hypothetical protein